MPTLTRHDATELFRRPPDDLLDVGAGAVAHRRVGSGPDVLFVHGWPVTGATFRTLGAPTWGTASSGSERTDTGGQRAILVTEATQAVAGATGTATVPQAPAWYGVLWTVALAPT